MKKILLLSLLIFPAAVHAQDFKVNADTFWTKQRIAATAVNVTARTFDTVQTCKGFAAIRPGVAFHEDFLPTQSCGGVVVFSAGIAGGSLFAERLIYKRHPRLAHIPQWASFAGAAAGIAYTYTHVKVIRAVQ